MKLKPFGEVKVTHGDVYEFFCPCWGIDYWLLLFLEQSYASLWDVKKKVQKHVHSQLDTTYLNSSFRARFKQPELTKVLYKHEAANMAKMFM